MLREPTFLLLNAGINQYQTIFCKRSDRSLETVALDMQSLLLPRGQGNSLSLCGGLEQYDAKYAPLNKKLRALSLHLFNHKKEEKNRHGKKYSQH